MMLHMEVKKNFSPLSGCEIRQDRDRCFQLIMCVSFEKKLHTVIRLAYKNIQKKANLIAFELFTYYFSYNLVQNGK
jgi:hypothetical protein